MPQSPPRWNLVSVVSPIAGFVAGFLVWTEGHALLGIRDFHEATFWGLAVWTASCVLGLVATSLALVRAERLGMVTAVGFLLSAILPGAMLLAGIRTLILWLRYG